MVRITLDAIVLAVTDETPKVLTTSAVGESALPSGDLDGDDRTLELGLRRVLAAQTGIGVGYAEQLYSFSDIDRSSEPEERLLGLAYLTLIHEEQPTPGRFRCTRLVVGGRTTNARIAKICPFGTP